MIEVQALVRTAVYGTLKEVVLDLIQRKYVTSCLGKEQDLIWLVKMYS